MIERKAIMVIEDDATVRQLIAEILRDAGHTVVECTSAEEALSCLETTRPALITLDLAMPSMDGVQFLSLIRRHASTAHLPVVVVTAAPEFLRLQLIGEGEAAIGKPFRMEQLLDVVDHALGMGRGAA